jgi:hypothetical protein
MLQPGADSDGKICMQVKKQLLTPKWLPFGFN